MLRFVVICLASILLITLVRSVVGIIMRGFANLVGGGSPAQPAAGPRTPPTPVGGELKRDPVCGPYIAETTSIKRTVGGEVYHFCSTECRDKYRG